MNGLAALLAAVALSQEPASASPAAEPPGAAADPQPPGAPAPTAPAENPASAPAAKAAPDRKPELAPAPVTARPKPSRATPTTTPTATPTATSNTTSNTTAVPCIPTNRPQGAGPHTSLREECLARSSERPATATPKAAPTSEHEEAERIARQFVAALARGDADTLAQLGTERFSFDGDAQSGREAVRRTWRALLAGRAGPASAVGRIEVVSLAEAVARHGKPPARLEPLARPGSLVAIVDVGGRTVVLFLAREGTRLAVTGMHD